jgi:hypothetical protein
MSNETNSTIIPEALNAGFSTDYCAHHGPMTPRVSAIIQALIKEAQEIHGVTDVIICQEDCDCPICRGQLEQCEECDGIFLMEEDEELLHEDEEDKDEYEADLDNGEEADDESISCLSPIELTGPRTLRSIFFDYEDEEEDEDEKDTPIQTFVSQIVSLRITD